MNKNLRKKKQTLPTIDKRKALNTTGPVSNTLKQKRLAIGIALLLAIVTLIVYNGVFKSDFLNFDDDVYITSNNHVLQGLTLDGFKWALSARYANNWHPLTWISHMMDVQLFKLNPAGHHFTSLFFHILATLLLFGFLRYLTGKLWISGFIAALFALHPLHVESVAWVAERKDVLSAVFWFAALWAYVYYVRRPNIGRYLTVLMLFGLGLLSKPMLVTLPIILLFLDYWPLERLNKQNFGRVAAEKLPMLLMSIASAIITIIAQKEAVAGLNRLNLGTRLSNAAMSYCTYIGQAFWPTRLAVYYPFVQNRSLIIIAVCVMLLIMISFTAFWIGRREKYLIFGWLWYLVTLIPVIGIMQVGGQGHADRYTYIPFIGIFITVAWGLSFAVDKLKSSKKMLMQIPLLFILIAISFKTWEQVGYWKNGVTLYRHAIDVTKKNDLAYNNLGFLLSLNGQTNEALDMFQKAVDINPNFGDAEYNLANALMHFGRTDEAVVHFRKALDINPNDTKSINNLCEAYYLKNQPGDAIPLMQKALALAKAAGDESLIKTITANLETLIQSMGSSQKP
ncbi:MAG: tetratricopeptide repeat protein [Chitinivibrionales bacterium]